MRLKKVIWIDIAGGDQWMSIPDASKWGRSMFRVEYETTGYIIHRNKRFLIVAATYDPDEEKYHDISMIPMGVVKRIEQVD